MFKSGFSILVSIFGMLLSAEIMASSEIHYSIAFNQQNDQCLDITSIIPSDSKNELMIHLPQRGIRSLNIQPHSGIEIAPFVRKFNFASAESITIQYQLCAENPKHHIDLPIIEKDFFQLTAINTLPLPLHREDSNIRIKFVNTPKNLSLISTDGQVQSSKVLYNGLLDEFSTFVLAGGTQLKKFSIGKRPVFALATNQVAPFPESRMANIEKITSFQQNLVNDRNKQPLLLTFVETPEHSATYARHFKNTLSISCPKNKTEEQLINVFSHEIFHDYIGWQLRAGHHYGELLWFIEGFDDYIGTAAAYQSEAISQKMYIDKINNLLKDYYLSPISNLPYNILIKKHQEDLQHNVTAQTRGHLAALTLQGESNNALENQIVTKIIKKMLNMKCNGGYCFVNPSFVQSFFKRNLNPEQYQQIMAFIETGNNIDLPKTLNKELKLIKTEVQHPKFNFDFLTFVESHVIKDLIPESPEYKAGLRNGMSILQYSLYLHDPHRKVTMKTMLNNEMISIEFFPETQLSVIPQYSPEKMSFT